MDSQLQFQFPPFFQLFFPFIILVALYFTFSNKKSKKVPPGPRKLPIIGNIHNIMTPLPPHRRLHQLSLKYGPLIHLKLGQVNSIVVSSPEMAKQALKTHDLVFLNRPFSLAADVITYGSSDLVYSQYGDYWRQLRKICILELLSVKRVQSFRPIREEEMSNFLRLISKSEGSEINFTKTLYQYMFSVISRAAFGKIKKEHQAFFPYIKEIMEVAAGFSIADLFPSISILQRIGGLRARMERIRDQTAKIIEAIIEDHTVAREARGDNNHNDDLVDVLLRLQQEGNVTLTPFGAGRRICPGMTFGLVNVELPLANMLFHFDWKLPGGIKNEDLDMTEAYGIAVKRQTDLTVIPVVAHPVM